MRMKPCLTSAVALTAAVGLSVVGPASASNLQRLSAEFQNNVSVGGTGEISTNVAAGPSGTGGVVVYDKTIEIPDDLDVLYVTFSAQADVHNGSALLMNATVNGDLIQPLFGQTGVGGGGPHLQTGWYTLSILPTSTGTNNCNDGGGGTADCHDNTIYFSGCIRLLEEENKGGQTADVVIKLADMPGASSNIAFYERSTIYIDGQRDKKGELCQGVGTEAH